jgi:hypothetical protein
MASRFYLHFNRPVVLLVVLSLLTSALAVVPTAIRAADPTPDYLPSFEACPEGIIPSAGYVDAPVGDPITGDINCIAYYGITRGTSATTYSPERPVIREHMALFLVRLARLVGISVPPAADTPFDDIDGLKAKSQEAISQLHQLGITVGATTTAFAPKRNVSRGEMAVTLQRLMDLMIPVADGRLAFGYTPDDVNDNDENFDVESPFQDLEEVSHTVNAAVTQLYELGVASGLTGTRFGSEEAMSRAAMAEFMAAILDHSNVRPKGILAQVTPTEGREDFEIVMMVSLRDDDFAPVEDVVVDWFYTSDPGGGLEGDGTCDRDMILGDGDCIWDDDDDETTDLDGNLFADFDAIPGATMSIYAWVGKRDGSRFDEDSAQFSRAQAKSEKDADRLVISSDIPADAAQISGNGAFIVDLDRRSSVEFTIQLVDDDGAPMKKRGVPIEIEVESRAVRVEAADVSGGWPEPDLVGRGRGVKEEYTVLTDDGGTATFHLRGPTRNERLDTVTIEADCCTNQIHRIAWSDGESVLVVARPQFQMYQKRNGNRIDLTVEYSLLDQYGDTLRSTDSRHTGRFNTELSASFSYRLFHAPTVVGEGTYTVEATGTSGNPSITIDRREVSADIRIEIPSEFRDGHEFLVAVEAEVFSDRDDDGTLDSNEIRYVDSQAIVWIVRDATSESEFDQLANRGFEPFSGLNLETVELYPASNKIRTFFTLWSYHASHKFQANNEFVDVETFEKVWQQQVDGLDDFDIPLYGSQFSLIVIR